MKTKKATLLFSLLALLLSAVLPPNIGSAHARHAFFFQQSATATRGEAISAERAARHVGYLAGDKLQGRRAGTRSADEAANYLAKEFERYGLKPAGKSFLTPFTFVSGARLGQKNRFQVQTTDGARALKVGADYMPLAFSSADLATGQAVFAGYGISAPELQYDNYAGLEVAGKIIIILRGSPDGDNPHGKFAEHTQPGLEVQKKTIKAREKGARGVVFISSEKSFGDDRLSQLRHDVNFLDASIPAAIISRASAEAIFTAAGLSLGDAEKRAKDNPAALSLASVAIEFQADVVKVEGQSANVVGILRGSDPQLANEYVILGAHYDHLGLGGAESLAQKPEGDIHHGADDNASGTSALLELARVLAQQRASVKRSLVFMAFSAEELGLLGSAAYTKNPLIPLASTVAMLNMDMVGRLRDGALTVGGVGTSPVWKPLLEKLNAVNGESGNGAMRFKLGFSQDGYGPSDHQSFYVRDIPVLFFFTGTHADYHKPSDTADKINAEGIRQIAEFVREIAVTVANEPQRIAFTKVKAETRNTGRGFRVSLGTVPNYADQGEGMKLDGVRAGSPAERAGLKAGDIILKLASIPIKNVYDYTYALGELTPGEEIEVLIRRDGKEMKLKLTPDKRQ